MLSPKMKLKNPGLRLQRRLSRLESAGYSLAAPLNSGKTNFLLAGGEAGSKLEKAAKLGVKVVSETEYHAMLE